MTIRPADAGDFDGVLALWAGARSAAAKTADTGEGLQRLLAAHPESLLVAEAEDGIVGTAIAAFDGWRGGIYRLAVAEEHRRRGIGTALARAAEESLHRRGCRRISLIVGADEGEALGFWATLGFIHDVDMARLSKNLD